MLRESNGGYLNYNKIDIDSVGDRSSTNMEYLMGIREEGEGNIFTARQEMQALTICSSLIPLSWQKYLHDFFALDYSEDVRNPKVVYFYENYSEENLSHSKFLVAKNFGAFLERLYYRPKLHPSQLTNR